MNIANSFTLEMSFCGSDFGKYEFYHFNINIYRDIANAFCQSLEEYYEPSQNKYRKALEELENLSKNPNKADDNNKKYFAYNSGTLVIPTTPGTRPTRTQPRKTVASPGTKGKIPTRNQAW